MSKSLLAKYTWILQTIQRYGHISRRDLCKLWQQSEVSGGEPLQRRTFYNYRAGIEELFGIVINYSSSTFEYSIDTGQDSQRVSSWLIDSLSVNGLLNDAADISDRVMLEEVPSAHGYLPTVIEAIKKSRRITLSYTPFYRVNATDGIVLEPYFLRFFKQRWYVIGYNMADRRIKTYSLDRINKISITDETFVMPAITVEDYFKDLFGIMSSSAPAKDVVLRVDSEEAKYLRALPLHHSQRESLCNGYSMFYLRLCLTYDFLQEILSRGDRIVVVAPEELKAMVVESLNKSVENYKNDEGN